MTQWVLPDRARLAMSFVVNVEEGGEMTIESGDAGPDPVDELGIVLRRAVRNYSNESNYQYGIKAGAPRVLELLRRYGIQATFTAAALSLERAPALAAEIVADGHEVCAHGWRWIHQYRMDEAAERNFIRDAVQSITRTTGTRPSGWLSRYLLTDNTRRLLVEQGLDYHMDDYSDDLPFWDHRFARPIVIMPYALDTNDMKLWTAPAMTPAMWLDYAIDTFEVLYREGADRPKMMSLGLHLRVIGRPGRIGYLERFMTHVRQRGAVWIASRRDIASDWARQHPAV